MSAEGAALLAEGRLREARDAFARCEREDPRSAGWRRSLDTWFALLEGRWDPPAVSVPAGRAVRGRIAHLVGASLPHVQTGYTVRTQRVAEGQRAAGLDPYVLTRWGTAAARERVDGIPYRRVGDAAAVPLDRQLGAGLSAAARLLGELRPAVLHAASDFVNARLALALREATGIPVVYEVRGLWEESWFTDAEPRTENDGLYELRRRAEVECMLAADRVVTLSQTMQAALVAAGVPAEHVEVVPNGVDPGAFAGTRSQGGELVLGYIGTIAPYEGLDRLLETAALLRDRGCPVKTVIVGDGGRELVRLKSQARELGIADRVAFPGPVAYAEVADAYRRIDLFVLPRRDDPVCRVVLPVKAFEAMAAGCALVVSDLPALREVVQPGRTGVAVRPADAGALAHAVEELAADPARRLALGARAREWVCAERTWAAHGRAYRRLYASLGAGCDGLAG